MFPKTLTNSCISEYIVNDIDRMDRSTYVSTYIFLSYSSMQVVDKRFAVQ